MVQLTDKHICVQLTEYYYELQIRNGELIWVDEKGFGHFATLPPGSYQLLFTTKEATEEQAEDLVDEPTGFIVKTFRNYEGGEGFDHAINSLQSLLASKGCDVDKNYAIIQKL